MAKKIILQLSLSLLLLFSHAKAQSYGELRLTKTEYGSSSAAGLLEIFLNDEWGTICDYGFDLIDANVACRQMGYRAAVSYTIGFHSPYGIGGENSSVWLSEIDCRDSNGQHLLSCAHGEVGEHDCDHYSDVAVVCEETPLANLEDGSLRLTGGAHNSEGIIEIACNGRWKTVCGRNERFGQTEADAVCWQLGFTQASNFEQREAAAQSSSDNSTFATLSPCTGEYHLCEFSCSDSDETCSMGNGSEQNTTAPSAIWIECNHTITYGTLRLTDVVELQNSGAVADSDDVGGLLEMFGEGKWGSVCGATFGSMEADIACHQLGYFRASRYIQSGSLSTPNTDSTTGHIGLMGVECTDEDEKLAYCSRPELPEDMTCTHDNDIILFCTNDPHPITTAGGHMPNSTTWPLPFSKRVLIEISAGAGASLILCCCCLIVWCTYCCCQRSSRSKGYKKHSQKTSLKEEEDSEAKEPDVIILAATVMDQLKPSPIPCASPLVPKPNENSTDNSQNGLRVFFPSDGELAATSAGLEGAVCVNATRVENQNGEEREGEDGRENTAGSRAEATATGLQDNEHRREKERQQVAGATMEPIPEEESEMEEEGSRVSIKQHHDGAEGREERESIRDGESELALDLASILQSIDGEVKGERPNEIQIEV